MHSGVVDLNLLPDEVKNIVNDFVLLCSPEDIKSHTIRAGNRWKVGDWFSPRVWSGKPYQSKQIIIAPDIEVKSVQEIKIEVDKDYVCVLIDNWPFFEENKNMVTQIEAFETLAKNDGLTLADMKAWFKYPQSFTGQIICWNENINY